LALLYGFMAKLPDSKENYKEGNQLRHNSSNVFVCFPLPVQRSIEERT
jgi:hypothetical protein